MRRYASKFFIHYGYKILDVFVTLVTYFEGFLDSVLFGLHWGLFGELIIREEDGIYGDLHIFLDV